LKDILLSYGTPEVTVTAIMMLYHNSEAMVRSSDEDTECFKILAGVLQGDTLAPLLFIIALDYVLRNSLDTQRELGFALHKTGSRRHPAIKITDADYADDLTLFLFHSLEEVATAIGLYGNSKAWKAVDKLTRIWKSLLTSDLKRNFFRAVVEPALLYGSTTWTLLKGKDVCGFQVIAIVAKMS